MMRVTLLVLLGLAMSLCAYLFVRPEPLQQGTPGARTQAALPSQPPRLARAVSPAHASARSAPVLLARWRRTGTLPRPYPAESGNPPRKNRRAHAAPLPLLHLPGVLPPRTLSVPILMYHHISSLAPATDLNRGLTVTDEDFTAQLRYLRQHGYHTILLRRLFDALYHKAPLPSRPIVLTFDDGYLDNYTDALPILRRAHDVGEFNIISAYPGLTVGVNSYMSWHQLKALVQAGMEIGSHTVDHQDLGVLAVDMVRFELRDSRNILQRTLGVPVQFLAYPAGAPFNSTAPDAPQRQQRVLGLVPEYGYVGAVLDGPLTTSRQDARQPFQLQRIRVAGGESLDEFAQSVQQ